MAKLSRDDILKLARLARLRLSETEVETYQKELSAILEYVAHLDSADTEGLGNRRISKIKQSSKFDIFYHF